MTRAQQILNIQTIEGWRRTERMFGFLMIFQWFLGLFFALYVSPQTWFGPDAETSMHVYAAVFLGGAMSALPLSLIYLQPAHKLNMYVIAISQMLYSTLLIHLSGGRIETHFHIFGSLALLAFYREWRVLAVASLVTALDHFVRGAIFAPSIYGVLSSSPWRALEHTAWVVFEDVFLMFSVHQRSAEARLIALTQADLEQTLSTVEQRVSERTLELEQSNKIIIRQQNSLLSSAKNSALGEMAGQIAHEINSPLGAIVLTAQFVAEKVKMGESLPEEVARKMDFILQVSGKINRIITTMRKMSGGGENEEFTSVLVKTLIEDTVLICEGRFKKSGIEFKYRNDLADGTTVDCRANDIGRVLINLLNNAHDAVVTSPVRRITLTVAEAQGRLSVRVSDSGPGVRPENRVKLFVPDFTTKSLDHGTGFGLSISKKLVDQHGGNIYLEDASSPTTFVVEIPFRQGADFAEAI